MSSPVDRDAGSTPAAGDAGVPDDFELRRILDVATAYLEAGQVDDAEDLLQEAIDVDPHHPEVTELARRLTHIRGDDRGYTQLLHTVPDAGEQAIAIFTRTLPGIEKQPQAIQRLAAAAEAHYAADRLFAALDTTQVMCAQAPGFSPGFVRLAELQLALGKVEPARSMYESLKRRYAYEDDPAPWMVDALGIALNPGDTSALIGYAMILVDAGDGSVLDPFVPEAIARAVSMNASAALELADRYRQLKPGDESASRLYLTVLAATGDTARLAESARSMVTRQSEPELLALRVAAEVAVASPEWLDWLEALLVEVRANPGLCGKVASMLSQVEVEDGVVREMMIARALVDHAFENWSDCLATLNTLDADSLSSERDQFVALYARATALHRLGDVEAAPLMLECARRAYSAGIEPFARSTKLFGVSAAPTEMLRSFSLGDDDSLSLHALIELRDANPSRLDIRSALAEALLSGGSANDAIRELRYIAQECERTGDLAGMIEAMRRMSEAAPQNLEMKAKLIEGYLRRGVLDESVRELDLIGASYLERGRKSDAVAAYTKAAEIASTLGDFRRGNELFDRAVLADPDNVPVRHAAVAFYLQTGAIDNATQQLREVVRIALTADDRDEAVAALHQIIGLAPQDAEAYHKLGEVLTALGEYTQAERVYRRLATFTPNDPVLEAKQSALAVLAATK